MTGMPLANARLVGSTKALSSVSAMAMPSALLVTAVSKALAISETLPPCEPVHCGSGRPSSAAASASPDLVGTKNEFVVTWLTNTNRQGGVLGNFPAPLAAVLLWAPAQAASSVLAATAPPPAPTNFRADLRDTLLVRFVIVAHASISAGNFIGPGSA